MWHSKSESLSQGLSLSTSTVYTQIRFFGQYDFYI